MTFDGSEIVRLVLWYFAGALAVALGITLAVNKTAKSRINWSIIVLLLFGAGLGGLYYMVGR